MRHSYYSYVCPRHALGKFTHQLSLIVKLNQSNKDGNVHYFTIQFGALAFIVDEIILAQIVLEDVLVFIIY